jgi:hypothetical protein
VGGKEGVIIGIQSFIRLLFVLKKRYLLLGLFIAAFPAFARKEKKSPYKKQKLSQTDISLLNSYYNQDGSHSAVTGGIGTEKLQVFATELTIAHKPDTNNTISINAGVDIITSASTDKIDFVVSSASRKDQRVHLNLGYDHFFQKPGVRLGIGAGLSLESDYTSLPVGIYLQRKRQQNELYIGLQCYFDDLRWGRVNKDHFRPVRLIYPAELRYREWYSTHNRQSYNLTFAFYQVINERMQIAFFPEVVYQKGLLSTPFHRVYFSNRFLKVENLPAERWKVPVGVQFNAFVGGRTIIRSYYRFYKDNFGITAHTLQVEVPVKLTPTFTLVPALRGYTQTASRYFKPYAGHDIAAAYYTSDYDLSAFNDIKASLTLRYAPQQRFLKHFTFSEIAVRYFYYKRSDGLAAHALSLLLDFKR